MVGERIENRLDQARRKSAASLFDTLRSGASLNARGAIDTITAFGINQRLWGKEVYKENSGIGKFSLIDPKQTELLVNIHGALNFFGDMYDATHKPLAILEANSRKFTQFIQDLVDSGKITKDDSKLLKIKLFTPFEGEKVNGQSGNEHIDKFVKKKVEDRTPGTIVATHPLGFLLDEESYITHTPTSVSLKMPKLLAQILKEVLNNEGGVTFGEIMNNPDWTGTKDPRMLSVYTTQVRYALAALLGLSDVRDKRQPLRTVENDGIRRLVLQTETEQS